MKNRATKWNLRLIEEAGEMAAVEELQRLVWPASETDVVPSHLLISAVHNGGLLIGAYYGVKLVGFVFGIPGIYFTPDGPRLKHYSHMLAVHPDFRNQRLGFALKRAQWQMVRHQGIDRITWTYDPLLSTNAKLNISNLGAVCNTYLAEFYGEMRNGLNVGLPSDRLQVDWWVNTQRVYSRLGKRAHRNLGLNHYLTADVKVINPTVINSQGWPDPNQIYSADIDTLSRHSPLLLIEIPADIHSLKAVDLDLALKWRLHVRELFIEVFKLGYIVTDFVYEKGEIPQSYYVLSHGESTL